MEEMKKCIFTKSTKKESVSSQNKANKSEISKENLGERIYFILFSLIAILIIAILATVLFVFIKGVKNGVNNQELLGQIDFSIILSSLTLLIGGSIVLPRFLLKQEVKVAVKEQIDNNVDETIKNKMKKHIEDEFNNTKNEANRMDAHISRMVAFFLREEYPLWSIGWAFRSLKRYNKLNEKLIGLRAYEDFVKFIKESILKNAKNNIHEELAKKELAKEESYFEVFEKEAKASEEPDPERPVIRAIKDIIDFEYAVFFTEIRNNEDKFTTLSPICEGIGSFARLLCVILIEHRKNKQQNQNKQEDLNLAKNKLVSNLMNEIVKISQFGPFSAKDNSSEQKEFSKRLLNVLFSLYDESTNTLELDKIDEKRTFFNIEECYGYL